MASIEINSVNSLINDSSLKAYYRFESGALTTDSSGEGHTLTAISVPTADASGKFGGAVAFAGDDAYSAVDHADFKPTGNFTVGFWIKTTSVAASGPLASFSQNTNLAGWRMYVGATTGTVQFLSGRNTGAVAGKDYQLITSTNGINDGNWHFVVGTYDGSYLRIYIDGVSDADAVAWTYAPGYAATNYVRAGCYVTTGTNRGFFTGSLDDVFLINGTALSADQIESIYDGTINSASPSISPSVSPSQSPSSSISPSTSPSISVSLSPSQSPSQSISPSVSVSISPSASPSTSISPSRSPSISVSASPSKSPSQSPSQSLSPSVSPSASPSASPSISVSISPSLSPSLSPSPSPGWQNYTKGDYAELPANDNDLENLYTAGDILNVATKNDEYAEQTATSQYAIHQFKDYAGANTSCNLEWEGQTNCSPSLSTVFLQIYNRNTSSWETVDSDNTSPANTDFSLTANVADLTNYKDASNVISCRVYQLDV